MSALNQDIVYLISLHIEPEPLLFCELSLVNKTFRKVFTSDAVWNRCNVYQLTEGIHNHFVESIDDETELSYLHGTTKKYFGSASTLAPYLSNQAPITHLTKNMYIWLQWFMTADPLALPEEIIWPEALPDNKFFNSLVVQICPTFVKRYSRQIGGNRYLLHKLMRSTGPTFKLAALCFAMTRYATDKKFCKSIVKGVQVYEYHPYLYFSSEARADPEIMDLVYASCPEMILNATNEPSKEFIEKYFPTEDVFRSLIRGKGQLVIPYLPFYDSVEVILAALDYEQPDCYSGGPFRDDTRLWRQLKPFHIADKKLVLRLVKILPWVFDNFPVELKTDRDVLLTVLQQARFSQYIKFDIWLKQLLSLPGAANIYRDREVTLGVLEHVQSAEELDKVLSWAEIRGPVKSILRDHDSALKLLKKEEFWYHHIKIPMTLEALKAFVESRPRDHIKMKYSLPTYCLECEDILKFGAGIFKNILAAPEKHLTREIVLENVRHGGLQHARLPESYQDDTILLCALLKGGLHGPIYNLQVYQTSFSAKALFHWDVLKIFLGEPFDFRTMSDFSKMQAHPSPSFVNLREFLETCTVRRMVESSGCEHGITRHHYGSLLFSLPSHEDVSNKRRRTAE